MKFRFNQNSESPKVIRFLQLFALSFVSDFNSSTFTMICDACKKDKKYYCYPSYCHHRFCMACTMNEVFCGLKCPYCNQHQQSFIHNLTTDENTVVLPLRDPEKIRKFLENMILVMGIEDELVDQEVLETNKKLFLEEPEDDETEELKDFNISDE